jgi:hypothetical protein
MVEQIPINGGLNLTWWEPPAPRTPCCCFERATTLAPGPCQRQRYPTKPKIYWEDTRGDHFFANIAKCNLFIYNSTRFRRAKLVPANFYIAPVNLSEKRVPPSPVASNSCNDLPHENIKKYWRTISHFNDSFGNWNHKILLYFALNLPILMVKWQFCHICSEPRAHLHHGRFGVDGHPSLGRSFCYAVMIFIGKFHESMVNHQLTLFFHGITRDNYPKSPWFTDKSYMGYFPYVEEILHSWMGSNDDYPIIQW